VKRPSPALVISIIALIFALGGTSIAAFKLKKNSVGSKQVKNDSLTGDDVNESTFGKVPSAATADKAGDATHAATADNADSLGGFSNGDFVSGNGQQFAFATVLGDVEPDGLSFNGTDELIVTCTSPASLTWENDFNDPGAPVTDVFTELGHTAVTDGAASTALGTLSNGSHDVEVWTGGDLLISARIGIFRNGVSDTCPLSMFANIEPNAVGLASAGPRSRSAGPASSAGAGAGK
jgi:hypothetical protein